MARLRDTWGRDAERTRESEQKGLRVIRLTDDQVVRELDAVVATIAREAAESVPSKYPT